MKNRTIILCYGALAIACLFLASCGVLSAEHMATANEAINHMVEANVITGAEGEALRTALTTPWYERAINGLVWAGATYAGIQLAPGVGVKRLIARTVAGAVQGATTKPQTPPPPQGGQA